MTDSKGAPRSKKSKAKPKKKVNLLKIARILFKEFGISALDFFKMNDLEDYLAALEGDYNFHLNLSLRG